jgi:hypothetical protein
MPNNVCQLQTTNIPKMYLCRFVTYNMYHTTNSPPRENFQSPMSISQAITKRPTSKQAYNIPFLSVDSFVVPDHCYPFLYLLLGFYNMNHNSFLIFDTTSRDERGYLVGPHVTGYRKPVGMPRRTFTVWPAGMTLIGVFHDFPTLFSNCETFSSLFLCYLILPQLHMYQWVPAINLS